MGEKQIVLLNSVAFNYRVRFSRSWSTFWIMP